MKGLTNHCSSCKIAQSGLIRLDCTHNHCLFCLNQDIEASSRQEMLSDEIQIECGACSCLTVLSLSLAIKLVRDLADRQQKRASEGNKMICRNCMDEFFDFEDYISGRHRNHQVQSLEKAFPYFKYLSQQAEKSLKQRLADLQELGEQTLHGKDILVDIMSTNIAQIKLQFDNLRQQLNKKEKETITDFQQIIQAQLQGLELIIKEVMEQISRGEEFCRDISEQMARNRLKEPNYHQKLQLARYIIQNKESITKFTTSEGRTIYQASPLLIEESRNTIKLDGLSEVLSSLKRLCLLRTKDRGYSKEKLSTSLGREYFDRKRSQMFDRYQITAFPSQQDEAKAPGKAKEVVPIQQSKYSPRSFVRLAQRK